MSDFTFFIDITICTLTMHKFSLHTQPNEKTELHRTAYYYVNLNVPPLFIVTALEKTPVLLMLHLDIAVIFA